MGFFSSLFKKNDKDSKKLFASEQTVSKDLDIQVSITPKVTPMFHKKGVADAKGLYPSDLIMLSVAERIKTTDKTYSHYFCDKYEIANPGKVLLSLYEGGFIEPGTCKDSLVNYKVAELKEFANSLGVQVKGKKADIIAQLQGVDETELSKYVKDKNWKRTEAGEKELQNNPYINYFLDKHIYNLEQFDINLWSVNSEFLKNPKKSYRDIIWRQLNKKQGEYLKKYMSQKDKNTFPILQYCDTFEAMGLFVEEEGKSFINASDYYFQYLFKKINLSRSLDFAYHWNLFRGNRQYQNEYIERFYDDIQLTEFERANTLRLIDECEYSDDEVRNALITSFKRAGDSGILSEEETADFVIFELTGDQESAMQMAKSAINRFAKKLR